MIGKHATAMQTIGELTEVFYHSTPVVTFNRETIWLKTGGFQTVTTKRRMNQVADTFDLGYHVFQKQGDWFVDYQGEVLPFDGEIIELAR
jgi:hypothetical protein